MPKLISLQVGLPKTLGDVAAIDPAQQPWHSGIFKSPVDGPVRLLQNRLEGDGQADLEHHGGPDKAVLAYSAEHYPTWREVLSLPLQPGGFGENLTVSELTENDVCIGDIWRIGDVKLQVSQPRQPCWKLGRRWQRPDLPKRVVRSGWSGWYLRVLVEGSLVAGQEIHVIERPYPQWSISQASQALYDRNFPVKLAQELTTIAELAEAWKEDLIGRLSFREM